MPILIKDLTWTQSSKAVHIRVPLTPGHDKVDLFATDAYLKAHLSPYFIEIFLLHDVDINKSTTTVKDDLIVFDLVKREEVEWESLEKELTRQQKMEMKQQILAKCHEEAKKVSEDKVAAKSHLDRFAVQQAMAVDAQHHAIMDSRRDAQRKKAMDELEEWRVAAEKPAIEHSVAEITDDLPRAKIVELSSSEDEEPLVNKPKPIKTPAKTLVKSEYVERKKDELKNRVLPKLRSSGEVEITHTARTFPTPSRESQAAEEEAWIKNITLARRATGFLSEDLRPEEQDPQWCKNKGDEFFRSGNYLGAISAYTHGITLSDKLPSLFANRAATHFALGNFNKCLNDCSTALELMQPACEMNRRSRAKCIARRAAALARIGYLGKAIDEMKAAAKLLPEDQKIKQDIFDMERAWEQSPDSD
ncbi:dynein axonemal assembly factor 4 [Plutella xylostella]|uniref:dynein axonemal assembly factor 4 n=1 Tax=Plutella xylostella TaxID=51655 RepID=UPI002032B043|nr:dynein axonemal assembly factor 4 [Plutella xylostella]